MAALAMLLLGIIATLLSKKTNRKRSISTWAVVREPLRDCTWGSTL